MRVMEEIGSRESLTKQIRLTDEYQRQLFNTSQQRDDLSLRNEKLSRQLAEAKDKREVQLAKISASKSHQQVKARLESARLTIWSLTQQLRAAETSRSSSPKVLPAKAPMKQLPVVQKTLPASSSQTALAVANQRIKELNSENQRLKQEMMKAEASAGRWEWNYRQLAAPPPSGPCCGGRESTNSKTFRNSGGYGERHARLFQGYARCDRNGRSRCRHRGGRRLDARLRVEYQSPWCCTRTESPWSKETAPAAAQIGHLTSNRSAPTIST